jgi:hypothetical protein
MARTPAGYATSSIRWSGTSMPLTRTAPLVGEVMDGAIVKRQRRRELESQFDWLERQVA